MTVAERHRESQRKWKKRNPHRFKQWQQSFEGYFHSTYYRIVERCSGIPGKSKKFYVGLPYMNKTEWQKFLEKTHGIRKRLFNAFVKSGRQRKYAPSINRIDHTKGYLPDNCEWLTVSENSKLSTRWA